MGGMNTQRARELRKDPTAAERALWKRLRLRQLSGYKFRRQQPIGPYIVDFVCFEKRLIIEWTAVNTLSKSSKRTVWLTDQGFGVLRFWNNEVLEATEAVGATILEALNARD